MALTAPRWQWRAPRRAWRAPRCLEEPGFSHAAPLHVQNRPRSQGLERSKTAPDGSKMALEGYERGQVGAKADSKSAGMLLRTQDFLRSAAARTKLYEIPRAASASSAFGWR